MHCCTVYWRIATNYFTWSIHLFRLQQEIDFTFHSVHCVNSFVDLVNHWQLNQQKNGTFFLKSKLIKLWRRNWVTFNLYQFCVNFWKLKSKKAINREKEWLSPYLLARSTFLCNNKTTLDFTGLSPWDESTLVNLRRDKLSEMRNEK